MCLLRNYSHRSRTYTYILAEYVRDNYNKNFKEMCFPIYFYMWLTMPVNRHALQKFILYVFFLDFYFI